MAIEDPDLTEVYGPLSVRGADDGNSIAPPAGAAWFDIGLVRGNDGVGIVYVTVTDAHRLVVMLTDGTVIDAGSVGGGEDGVRIVSAKVNPSGHLIVTLSNGEVLDAGYVVGPRGEDGLSAYQVAVSEGFAGTEAEWLASLVGPRGEDGLSAYQVAVSKGFVGTEAEWLDSLKGPAGPAGPSAVSTDAGNTATLGSDSLIHVPASGESAQTLVVAVPNTGWSGSVTLPVAGLTGPHVVSPVTAAGAQTWAAGGWWASSPANGQLTITGDIQPSADPVDVRVVWWS